MREGFVLQVESGGRPSEGLAADFSRISWWEVMPKEISTFFGKRRTKVFTGRGFRIITHRCERCGRLEQYALHPYE
jgi:hypothetical protein